MRVALAQLAPRLGEVGENLGRVSELIDEALVARAELIVLPECALSGYALAATELDTALSLDDPRLLGLSDRAGDAALVIGLHERAACGASFSSAVWLERGAVVHVHRKVYLSGGRWAEERHFAPGSAVVAFEATVGRVAMLVCNDAWHSVAPWLAAQDGARLLVIVAASADALPGERLEIRATWGDLLRAIARLSQLHVVFVNRSGDEAGFRYWGGSRILDPWGRELACAGREECLTVMDVDPDAVGVARSELDIGAESRLDVVAGAVARLSREER